MTKDIITPKQYFEMVKDRRQTITDDELKKIYDNCLVLLNKYMVTGQTKGAQKLIFHLETIEKEIEVVREGVNTFIYRDDIEEFIEDVAKDTVKLIELKNYEREIPDEVVESLDRVKDKFNAFYVMFTDYTGKIERKVEKERRDKDPILFATFQDETTRTVIDRFYYIGDWEDEYCDLTLDKFVNQFKEVKNKEVVRTISTPKDIKDIKEQLSKLSPNQNGNIVMSTDQDNPTSFFGKVKTFLRFK